MIINMNGLKTVLFYVLGVAGLIAFSAWSIGRIEVDINPLPPTATPVRPSAPTSTPRPACLTTPGGLTRDYLPDAPFTGNLAPPDLAGQPLIISGTVYAADCVTPLAGALIEVWHPDRNGKYDRTQPYSLRAKLRTDALGRYRFITIKPGYIHTNYFILPPFIHYRVSHQGQLLLSTQLFFEGDYFFEDYWSAFPDLVIPLGEQPGPDGPVLQGVFNLTLPLDVEQ